jgi:hypothetical protein
MVMHDANKTLKIVPEASIDLKNHDLIIFS